MTDKDKRQLVVLLRRYQVELLDADESNKEAEKKYAKWTQEFYNHYKSGIKAQYDHARIIADRLDKEISEGISRYL